MALVHVVKSHGRKHGKSTDGVDSGAERLEMEVGMVDDEKVANSSLAVTATSANAANLYNASNMPKETWKQVEKYEGDLRKNPQDVSALVGWGRLLVKVARDVIATHTSPESVKNVRQINIKINNEMELRLYDEKE